MFDFGWDEMALIAVVTLIVIGPKDLPKVLRQAGRWSRKARDMASEFQRGIDDMIRESELKEVKSQLDKVTDTNALRAKVEATIDPTGAIARGVAVPELDAGLKPVTPPPEAPPPETPVALDPETPAHPPAP